MHEFKKVMFENYFNMKGRASRREYWMFVLIVGVVSLIIDIASAMVFTRDSTAHLSISTIVSLIFLCPGICVMVRRLHDIGKRGTWAFILLIPLAGPVILIVFMIKKSQEGSNEFGPSPLALKNQAG
ncbi:DUF805 domain-containing protein [Klebsiella huaxiensis]|uniref:Inner membrane protein YhaH n=1 Tax=Klebsiella huaxiensis TaxID=2153354 RepID=A0A564NKV7_9ENTR|nr:DUF805 domain-containing protein [Klebsiella huaxiensis]VUT06195.1 Inner membrane protein YhaH [Klebsiella huaxiensis]